MEWKLFDRFIYKAFYNVGWKVYIILACVFSIIWHIMKRRIGRSFLRAWQLLPGKFMVHNLNKVKCGLTDIVWIILYCQFKFFSSINLTRN